MSHKTELTFTVRLNKKGTIELVSKEDDLIEHTTGAFKLKIEKGSPHDRALRELLKSRASKAKEEEQETALPEHPGITDVLKDALKMGRVTVNDSAHFQEEDVDGSTDEDEVDESELDEQLLRISSYAHHPQHIIPLGYRFSSRHYDHDPVSWDYSAAAHLAITGPAASGKTHLAKNIQKYCTDVIGIKCYYFGDSEHALARRDASPYRREFQSLIESRLYDPAHEPGHVFAPVVVIFDPSDAVDSSSWRLAQYALRNDINVHVVWVSQQLHPGFEWKHVAEMNANAEAGVGKLIRCYDSLPDTFSSTEGIIDSWFQSFSKIEA